MKANINNIQRLIDEVFDGNKAAFARTVGVQRTQISMLLNHDCSVGAKFLGAFILFCDENGLNFREYIFLP